MEGDGETDVACTWKPLHWNLVSGLCSNYKVLPFYIAVAETDAYMNFKNERWDLKVKTKVKTISIISDICSSGSFEWFIQSLECKHPSLQGKIGMDFSLVLDKISGFLKKNQIAEQTPQSLLVEFFFQIFGVLPLLICEENYWPVIGHD